MFATNILDAEFTRYFNQTDNDYCDETSVMKDITLERLLKKAKTKYDLICSQGAWGTLSQEAQDIIALQAKLKNVQSNNLKLTKKYQEKVATANKPNEVGSSNKKEKGKWGNKKKNKKDTTNKKKQKVAEAWMKIPPKDW